MIPTSHRKKNISHVTLLFQFCLSLVACKSDEDNNKKRKKGPKNKNKIKASQRTILDRIYKLGSRSPSTSLNSIRETICSKQWLKRALYVGQGWHDSIEMSFLLMFYDWVTSSPKLKSPLRKTRIQQAPLLWFPRKREVGRSVYSILMVRPLSWI